MCGENNNKKNVQNPSASSGGAFPGGGEDSLAKIMEQFKDLDQNPEFQNVMENMMQQLMSKDVLYEPMQEMIKKLIVVVAVAAAAVISILTLFFPRRLLVRLLLRRFLHRRCLRPSADETTLSFPVLIV